MMDKEQHLTLPCDVADVPRLAAFIDQICEEAGIGMSTAMEVNLAVEEAVVNVMNYAYAPGTEGTERSSPRPPMTVSHLSLKTGALPSTPQPRLMPTPPWRPRNAPSEDWAFTWCAN